MRIPNTTTIAAIREARTGEGITTHASLDELQSEFDWRTPLYDIFDSSGPATPSDA